jgi:hypothetical protein
MSHASPQLAPTDAAAPQARGLLAHLLHALNQPLTGLQCSLDVALAGPRQTEQYVSTLRAGLDLTARMRILVESIRELADQYEAGSGSQFPLEVLLRETAADLHPVAEARNVQLLLACQPGLLVVSDHSQVAALVFRMLESTLNLAADGSELRVSGTRDDTRVWLSISWTDGSLPEHSPFSRPELGLLIAQAGWERMGAAWDRRRTAAVQTCTIRFSLASSASASPNAPSGILENERQQNVKLENMKLENMK